MQDLCITEYLTIVCQLFHCISFESLLQSAVIVILTTLLKQTRRCVRERCAGRISLNPPLRVYHEHSETPA